MRRIPISIALPVLGGAAVVCGTLAPLPAAAAGSVSDLFARYYEAGLERNPMQATYVGDHRWGSELTDESGQAHARHAARLQEFLAEARAVDGKRLSAADRLSLAILEREIERSLRDHSFARYQTPISQQGGIHLSFPQLVQYHPFDTVEHVEDYLSRLGKFPRAVDQVIENMRDGMERGNVSWRGTIEMVLPQVRELAEMPGSGHPLAGALGKLGESLPQRERDRLGEAIVSAIDTSVRPAYAKLHAFLGQEYLPACRDEPGVHALPDGDALYAWLARRFTTTGLAPREIHDLGLAEMTRIRGEMQVILERVGFDGDLAAFFEHLRSDPRFYHTGKEALIEEFRGILARMDAKLPELFGRLPETPYDLTEIEEYRAASAPAAYYYPPPDDGSRPGYFYVNTYDLPSRPRYTMEALAYHEAVPGHHLQIALAQELDLPDFRRHGGFTSFVEGWALYSERLGKEVGLYEDPYSDFGRLTFEAWRASRLVVDTGIHAFGWPRERAIEYLQANSALTRHDIESEVDRYIAWPGQALAYKIGEIRIRELRAEAEEELGDRFDVRDFHDVLLENGALPLDVLETRVREWITDASATF